uniref:hAT-like transposase RNase-H fold domain-containing protein n=1 Tax=Chenopodium quinoa TaxID=63459 RepID=A0A803LEJ4_CHEQI
MLLMELECDDDIVLRTMAIEKKSKFDKYWFNSEEDNYSMLFAFAVIFYPRCKLSVLKFCYEKILGDVEATLKVSDLQFKLEKFYKLYTQNGTSTTPNINTNMGNASSSKISTSTSYGNCKRKLDYFASYDDKEASSTLANEDDGFVGSYVDWAPTETRA